MAGVVRVHEVGGPEVLRFEDTDVGSPGPGQALIRQTAVGLNYIDVYFRSGLYPPPQLPFTPGLEGAGVVEAVGEGVSDLRPGQRVAYAAPPIGAYAERRLMPADRLVVLPDGISDEQAAAMMLKGMTAQYLLRRTYRVAARPDHPVPCRRGRRRLDRLPVGQAPRRHGDRHRRERGQGRARAREWLRPRDPLRPRGRGGAGARDHRRQRRAGGLRFGRVRRPSMPRSTASPRSACW